MEITKRTSYFFMEPNRRTTDKKLTNRHKSQWVTDNSSDKIWREIIILI